MGPRLKLAEIVINRANSMYKNYGAKLRPHDVKIRSYGLFIFGRIPGNGNYPRRDAKCQNRLSQKLLILF